MTEGKRERAGEKKNAYWFWFILGGPAISGLGQPDVRNQKLQLPFPSR